MPSSRVVIAKLTKNLIWYTEAIAETILLHKFPVLFGSFTPHIECVMWFRRRGIASSRCFQFLFFALLR